MVGPPEFTFLPVGLLGLSARTQTMVTFGLVATHVASTRLGGRLAARSFLRRDVGRLWCAGLGSLRRFPPRATISSIPRGNDSSQDSSLELRDCRPIELLFRKRRCSCPPSRDEHSLYGSPHAPRECDQ